MGETSRKRISVKYKCPNPLFEQWLIEWRDKAKEKESKMQYCFSNALATLRKYPLPLESGKDCKILKGFGDKLCRMLDDKLKESRLKNGVIPVNVNTKSNQKPKNETKTTKPKSPKSPKRQSSGKDYIPQFGSGAYAILIALYEKSQEPQYQGYLSKKDIIEKGQPLCNVSFTKAGPDSRYTGWSSMKTLLQKDLIKKEGNPPRFSLTDEGTELAEKLYIQQKIEEFQKQDLQSNVEIQKPSNSGVNREKEKKKILVGSANSVGRQKTASYTSSMSTTQDTIILAPNSFEIILLVDNQELNSSKQDLINDPIIIELSKHNILYETRNLKVGDYTWICRDNFNHENELILPYIIERKRMDDLGSSIKDSRFHEQKFRLKKSGIPNLIYLIESYGKNEQVGLPINTLYQAATNTLIHDKFTVKFTDNLRDSCEYLATLTEFLKKLFQSKMLVSCSKDDLSPLDVNNDLIHLMVFKEFNKASAKSRQFKVSEMFVKQLLQIKGMSVEKALAIVDKFPTPLLLKLKFNEMNEVEGEKLLANISCGALGKNLGPVLSKIVYQLFCKKSY